MPKMKTSDCVAEILTVYPETNKSDWKRQKKLNVGESVFRIFKNTKTEAIVNVIETDGALTVDACKDSTTEVEVTTPVTPTTNHKRITPIYYLISQSDDAKMDGFFELYLEDITHWNSTKCLNDWTPEDASMLLNNTLGLYEMCDATLEVPASDLNAVIAFVQSHPDFQKNAVFDKFMLGYGVKFIA